MAGLGPAIHVFTLESKTWMPGINPGMTTERAEFVILLSFRGVTKW
jgi:hypothetical protein